MHKKLTAKEFGVIGLVVVYLGFEGGGNWKEIYNYYAMCALLPAPLS